MLENEEGQRDAEPPRPAAATAVKSLKTVLEKAKAAAAASVDPACLKRAIEDEGGKTMAEVLKVNSTLQHLNMGGNRLCLDLIWRQTTDN